jgi:hypothetical protein
MRCVPCTSAPAQASSYLGQNGRSASQRTPRDAGDGLAQTKDQRTAGTRGLVAGSVPAAVAVASCDGAEIMIAPYRRGHAVGPGVYGGLRFRAWSCSSASPIGGVSS